MPDHKKKAISSRKRKRESSPPQNSITTTPSSSTYVNAFKTGMVLFQDVADAHPKLRRRARHTILKKSAHVGTVPPQKPSNSMSHEVPRTLAPVTKIPTWKLDEETGTFVTVVPIHKAINQPARPAISKPRYHRPASSADLHNKQGHASLFSSTVRHDSDPRHQTALPEAVESSFPIQYPTYARSLDHFSVEQTLSRHARRRAAAARKWDHEIIPSLIRPYMAYIRQSKWGQSPIDPPSFECSCGGPVVCKVVTTVYMDRKYFFLIPIGEFRFIDFYRSW
jgi:hypothetical protein